MSLSERLKDDLKTALKSGDRERAEVLRFANAQLQNRSIEKRGKGESEVLTDDEIVDVFRKDVKRRKDSISMFREGGRADLVAKEEKELAIMEVYLPAVPDADEIKKVVQELRAQGMTEFPVLMKEAMKRLKGADGTLVSQIVKEG